MKKIFVDKGSLGTLILIFSPGREVEWLFATAEGRTQLCDSASCARLVVVHLARDSNFTSLSQVQEELAGTVLELAPDNLPPKYQVILNVKAKPNFSLRHVHISEPLYFRFHF